MLTQQARTNFSTVITKIKNQDACKTQLQAWYPTADEAFINSLLKEVELPLLAQSDFTDVQKEMLMRTERIRECGLNTVNRIFPLGEGEQLDQEHYTVFEKSFGDASPGMVALVRETSYMEVVIIMYFGRLDTVHLSIDETKEKQEEFMLAAADPVSVIVGKAIITSIISTIVGKIVGKAMDTVMDKIFPKELPSYYKEVIAEVRAVVREELDQQTLDHIETKISSIADFIRQQYLPRKEKIGYETKEAREELSRMLAPYNREFWLDIIGKLRSNRYYIPGYAMYMDATCLRYTLLMEQALVDPFASDIWESSYIQTIMNLINESDVKHLEKCRKDIYGIREKLLDAKTRSINTPGTSLTPGKVYDYYWFEDAHSGYTSEEYMDDTGCKGDYGYDKRDNAMNSYRDDTFIPKINKDLEPLDDLAAEWRKLLGTLTEHARLNLA